MATATCVDALRVVLNVEEFKELEQLRAENKRLNKILEVPYAAQRFIKKRCVHRMCECLTKSDLKALADKMDAKYPTGANNECIAKRIADVFYVRKSKDDDKGNEVMEVIISELMWHIMEKHCVESLCKHLDRNDLEAFACKLAFQNRMCDMQEEHIAEGIADILHNLDDEVVEVVEMRSEEDDEDDDDN